jgi:aromatic ring-cleaving dioxygenase
MIFHAHIYWSNETEKAIALSFRDSLEEMGCDLGSIHEQKVGPHSLPMYQVEYSSENKGTVEDYLQTNAETLSILLHEDTGDEIKDHTEGANWIGRKLFLNLDWLEEYTRLKQSKTV